MSMPGDVCAAFPSQDHVVHFYDDEATRQVSVADFLTQGLESDEQLVVIATPENWQAFHGHLSERGQLVDRALRSGRITVHEARQTLASFMRRGRPEPATFERVLTNILDRAARPLHRPLRLYGEMVDLLCRDGHSEAAVELERLWGGLGQRRNLSLFCGYAIESLATVDDGLFAQICAEHSRVVLPEIERAPAYARLRKISDAERRRKEAEGFRLLVESVKDYAIYMLDPRGVVTTWNAGAERIKGYRASEIIGSHFSRFYPEGDVRAGKCECGLEGAERDGRFEDEGYRVRKDGSRFWANVIITALRDESGRLVGFAKVTRDLTEQRKAEQDRLMLLHAQETSRIKDEFLATISHELRTPLCAILGWATLLAKDVHDPRLAKGIETIRRNAHTQSRIIDDVLDVARIVSGKLSIEPRSVDLVGIVQGGVEGMRPAAEAKGLKLVVGLPSAALSMHGDATRLEQVVWNLLSNAVKFTPSGGTVAVSLELAEAGARLVVSDTGCGIEADFLPRVFERFSQGDASSARRAGGLGLGLALARHLIERHGGEITVSSPGRDGGAVFTVVFPAGGAQEEAALRPEQTSSSRTKSEPVPGLRGVRVLVVEDEPDARELVGALLESRGAAVELAASAAEAYRKLESQLPDVILSDIGMPDEDGYQFAQHVRKFPAERGGRTPLVALTAYASAQDHRRAADAGYDHHLSKPVDTDELMHTLARLARAE